MKLNRTLRRKFRVRNKLKISNKENRPRIVIYRSNKNLYAQLINFDGKVVCQYSTLAKDSEKRTGLENAKLVGIEFGKRCLEKNVKTAIFDKSSYSYLGRVKELAEGCRIAGLKL